MSDFRHQEFSEQAAMAATTGRSEEHFVEVFGISSEERVLDLGSGYTTFDENLNVVQLDFAYSNTEAAPTTGMRVAGLYQELPFASDSFDRVTMRFGARWMSVDAAQEMMHEALRVVDTGGAVDIFPVKSSYAVRKVVRGLADAGEDVTHEIPSINKKRVLGFTGLTASSVGVGLALGQVGLDEAGIAVAAAVGGAGGLLAWFHARTGVLELVKGPQHENNAYRDAVVRRLAPLIVSPENVRI